jgi:hypothetical protein
VGLFYYAGHGMEESGRNYLIPVGATLETRAQLSTQTVSLEKVLTAMDEVRITAKMIVLDCCRNDPFGNRSWRRSRGNERGLAPVSEMQLPEATMLVFSAAPGKVAFDGSGSNSPFTKAFVTEIKAPGVSFMDAFFKIADSVRAETGEQEPWIKFDGAGRTFRTFSFVLTPAIFVPTFPSETQSEGKKSLANLSGRVQDQNGNPITGATIRVAGLSEVTDSDGNFEFVIPSDRLKSELDLTASAAGYGTAHYKAVPNANAMVIPLARAH